MKVLNNRLYVRFDEDDKRIIPLGDTGVKLIRPDEWVHKDEDGNIKYDDATGVTKWEENTNYLETKPQVCEVLAENPQYPYKFGDKLFTHYMAWTTVECGDYIKQEGFILAEYVICTLMPDGTYKMANDIYLGEQELTDDEVTPSGIIINVLGQKPKLCQVKLIHLPEKTQFDIGEVILTIDNYNYQCEIGGKKYIMLREREIVGRIVEEV